MTSSSALCFIVYTMFCTSCDQQPSAKDLDVQARTTLTASSVPLEVSSVDPPKGIGVAITVKSLLLPGADGEEYRKFVKQHRYATVADALRPVNFERSRAGTNKKASLDLILVAIDSLTSWGLTVKGHFLIRGDMQGTPMVARYLSSGTESDLRPALKEILDPIAATYPGVSEWDFLNHPYLYEWNEASAKRLQTLFAEVKQKYPDIVLGVNEGKVISASETDKFLLYCKNLELFRTQGIHFDFIGVMSHFSLKDPMSKETIQARTQKLKKYGPIIVTEFDVLYGKRNTLSRDAKSDRVQADQTRDYLSWLIENDDIVRFISWGFWAPEHWYPNAAYFAADWSLTPNGQVYIRHFHLQ